MAILKDEYGNDLLSGDEISVGEYIQALDSWYYEYGTYREMGDKAFLRDANDDTIRELYLYDYIRITKPIRTRQLYGYRNND